MKLRFSKNIKFLLKSTPIFLVAFVAFLGGCSKNKVTIDGERETVIFFAPKLTPDEKLKSTKPVLPQAKINAEWTQQAGTSESSLGALAYEEKGDILWTMSIGSGSGQYNRLLNKPIFAQEKIFAYDAYGNISAFQLSDRKKLWKRNLTPKGASSSQALGGGICYGANLLFATTGFGDIFALDPQTGEVKWNESSNSPIRIAPVYHKGKVFTITIENQLEVRSTVDGSLLWSHSGISESAGMLGGAGPTITHNTVIVPYGSGEVYALNIENGQVLWQQSITSGFTESSLGMIAHIHAQPVVQGSTLFVISHSGVMAALDIQSGQKLWSLNVGGIQTPIIIKDNLFVLSDTYQLLNLTLQEGKIRWVSDLPMYTDKNKKGEKIFWSGPILGDGKLYCVGSHKKLVSIDAFTGAILKTIDLPGVANLPPQIVNNTLYVLCDNGSLVAIN